MTAPLLQELEEFCCQASLCLTEHLKDVLRMEIRTNLYFLYSICQNGLFSEGISFALYSSFILITQHNK